MSIHWKNWCWSWNSNTSATWCEELTHLKRPWCWERLKARGEGDDRGWDGWIASTTQWTWVWVNSGSWWWTGRAGMLQSMGLQRVRHNWATELNWTEALADWYHKGWEKETSSSFRLLKIQLRISSYAWLNFNASWTLSYIVYLLLKWSFN